MKKIILLISFLFSFQLYAAACKCNCNPMDITLCAPQNDTEHPCHSACVSTSSGMAPQFTACPVTKVFDPVTGLPKWLSNCAF